MPERNASSLQMSTAVARTVGRATKITENSKFSFISFFPFFLKKKKKKSLLAGLQYAFPLKPVEFTETESLPQLNCYSG